jgi:thiaminase
MILNVTDNEYNLIMNLLDAHVENLQEWAATEDDEEVKKECEEYEELLNKLGGQQG